MDPNMNDHPTPTFLRIGGIFVFGIGLIGLVIGIVNWVVNWQAILGFINSLAFLYVGGEMYQRSGLAK